MGQDGSSPSNSQATGKPSEGQEQGSSGQRRDQTAEGPKEGEGDKPGQQKPGEQNKPGEDGDPKGNQEDKGEGQNQVGPKNPDGATQDASPAGRNTDVWGNLPIHLQDIFRAEGGADMPAQYRDWIDAYYRRLNERSGG
tara:strand:- start:5158 stop:5574 length:417 start_codon:yes stop_codon:yes gene_type:complete